MEGLCVVIEGDGGWTYPVCSTESKLLLGNKSKSHDVSAVEILFDCLSITTVPQSCD